MAVPVLLPLNVYLRWHCFPDYQGANRSTSASESSKHLDGFDGRNDDAVHENAADIDPANAGSANAD